MKPVKRGRYYYIDARWRGYPRVHVSTRTTNKSRATAILNTLNSLRNLGRKDLLGLLAAGRIDIRELHEAFLKRGDELEQLLARSESPELGSLVDEWLGWCRSPAGISPKTKRRYAEQTVRRYQVSWEGFFEHLTKGRHSRFSDITDGFVADYRSSRTLADGGSERNTRTDGARPSAATINRDLIALKSFLRWCRDEKKLAFVAPRTPLESEPQGRERWLSPDELRAVEGVCDPQWWTLFATLVQTGMRIGEAQGLVWGDVRLSERRISIHEGVRRVKTQSSVRDVPITEGLAEMLGKHAASVPSNPADPVFPPPLNNYESARNQWQRACLKAGLHDGGEKPKPNATIHDLRHTFGVAAARAGVPIVRLQKLLGHTTPHMTLRYMSHGPQAFFKEDAASIAEALSHSADTEEKSRADLARRGLKSA